MGRAKKKAPARGKTARVKTKRSARCRHDNWHSEYMPDLTSLRWTRCDDCRTLLPLCPSNDDPEPVRVEMRAAELEETEHWEPRRLLTAERWGWVDHGHPGLAGDEEKYTANQQWAAGWLSGELELFDYRDHDANAWPWDPTRPVAGQYEEWLRAAEAEASTPSRHLDGWTGPDELDDQGMDDEESPDPDATATPLTTSIDSSTVQIVGLYDVPAAFTPDEANELADVLTLGADAARQAARDGHHGPAVVVELCVGEEPEQGEEIEVEQEDLQAGGPALTTAEVYELWRAAEPDCRDEDGPEVERLMAEPFRRLDVRIGLPGDDMSDPVVVSDVRHACSGSGSPDRIPPTAANCKLLGAERCEHDQMTAEETQAVFGGLTDTDGRRS